MNKEITPNEIANAIRNLLEERDEFQERLKEQDKSLQSWYNDYHKLNNKYKKQKAVLDKIKEYIKEWREDDGSGSYGTLELLELLEEIE